MLELSCSRVSQRSQSRRGTRIVARVGRRVEEEDARGGDCERRRDDGSTGIQEGILLTHSVAFAECRGEGRRRAAGTNFSMRFENLEGQLFDLPAVSRDACEGCYVFEHRTAAMRSILDHSAAQPKEVISCIKLCNNQCSGLIMTMIVLISRSNQF
jgi:hypothetical protein